MLTVQCNIHVLKPHVNQKPHTLTIFGLCVSN